MFFEFSVMIRKIYNRSQGTISSSLERPSRKYFLEGGRERTLGTRLKDIKSSVNRVVQRVDETFFNEKLTN